MELIAISLYAGSLFLILYAVAPTLLRTRDHKNLAGRFYGQILWKFYRIAFFLLLVYLIFGEKWLGILLLAGLSANVAISMWLKNYKKVLGNIENHPFNSPERVRFRKVSYLSTAVLFANLLLSVITLLKEVR